MHKFLIIIILVLFSTGCNRKNAEQASVSGKFSDGKDICLVLTEMQPQEMKTIDSVNLQDDGSFNFRINMTQPGFWLLKAPSGKVLVLVIHPGDKIELTGSIENFPDKAEVNGSEEAIALHRFYQATGGEERIVDSLEAELVDHQEEADFYRISANIDTAMHRVWERQHAREAEYLQKHCADISSLVVLNYAFGIQPVLSEKNDSLYFLMLDSALTKKFPGNKHVVFHHQRVLMLKQ